MEKQAIPVAEVVAVDGVTPSLAPVPGALAAGAPEYLRNLGLPAGVCDRLIESCAEFEERIWIIDNSGSMATQDGHRIIRGAAGREGMVSCSRWEELGQALMWHAQVAAHLHAPTTFRMLNPPGRNAPQIVQVGLGNPAAEISAMEQLVQTGPTGRTPLCAHVREVVSDIAARASQLRASGRRIVVNVASDGAASDGDIEPCLRPLRELPAWVVVRLCTDDDAVVQYWNGIDEELELDMDVLDDLSGEAAEVCENNRWLTYGAPLHRLREWGTSEKVLDMLDERSLTLPEVQAFARLLFGEVAADLPHPQLNFAGFVQGLERVMGAEADVWDPLRNRRRAWISISKLRKHAQAPKGCVVS